MEPGSRPYTKPLIRYQKLAERVGFEPLGPVFAPLS
jgi:hypothetical protein